MSLLILPDRSLRIESGVEKKSHPPQALPSPFPIAPACRKTKGATRNLQEDRGFGVSASAKFRHPACIAATLEAMRAMNIYRLMASDGVLERSVDPHRSYD